MDNSDSDDETSHVSSGSEWYWRIWMVTAAFGTYFCMYAFRKPFTAATYEDLTLWGVGYKTVLVTAQVLGYTLSKLIGIKVVSETRPESRAMRIVVLIGLSEAALLLFAVIPAPYNLVALFLNGLPLGMVFGLVLGFLEGRLMTEALTAGLCASFILADGVAKSVGSLLLKQGVPERWMPFGAGLLFVIPLGICIWMLTRIPRPSRADVVHRGERAPLNRTERWSLFSRYAPGLIGLVMVYLFVTILRSIRADFAPEIWQKLGQAVHSGIFSQTEMLVAFAVLIVNGSSVLIRDNRRAFFSSLGVSFAGIISIAVALVGLQAGVLDGFTFIVLVGLGLYLPYVAVQTTLFERLMAMTQDRGTIGFLMYVADSAGYLGYASIMLGQGSLSKSENVLDLFLVLCWGTVALSSICLAWCWGYFAVRCPRPALVPESAVP